MEVTKSKPKDDDSDEYIDYTEEETINSMIPIWRQNRSELTEEDYTNFYQEKQFGFDKALTHIHTSVGVVLGYHDILYIPETVPFFFFLGDYEIVLDLFLYGFFFIYIVTAFIIYLFIYV